MYIEGYSCLQVSVPCAQARALCANQESTRHGDRQRQAETCQSKQESTAGTDLIERVRGQLEDPRQILIHELAPRARAPVAIACAVEVAVLSARRLYVVPAAQMLQAVLFAKNMQKKPQKV